MTPHLRERFTGLVCISWVCNSWVCIVWASLLLAVAPSQVFAGSLEAAYSGRTLEGKPCVLTISQYSSEEDVIIDLRVGAKPPYRTVLPAQFQGLLRDSNAYPKMTPGAERSVVLMNDSLHYVGAERPNFWYDTDNYVFSVMYNYGPQFAFALRQNFTVENVLVSESRNKSTLCSFASDM